MLKSVTIRSTLAAVACCMSFSVHAMADAARRVDIPQGSLATALQTLAKQTGIEFIFSSEQLKDIQTRGVHGTYTTEKAVTKLLQGTKLHVTVHETGAFLISSSGADGISPNGRTDENEEDPKDDSQGKSLADRFRVAQAPAGQTSSAASVSSPGSREQQQPVLLEEVIVTAQKRAERLADVPISISVLGGDQLDSSTVQGVSEALNSVPGVTAVGGLSGGTLLVVRGVTASNASFSGSSPIAYYLDSVPFGLVDSALVPDTSPYDLQRVEALRGPQGTLYGAGGEGGVVRVLTNDANLSAFELKGRTTGSYTEYGGANYGADMALNVPLIQDVLAARAVIDYQNLSGWIDKPQQSDANDAQLRNARFKINAQPTDRLSIGLSAWVSRQAYGALSEGNDDRQNTKPLGEPISVDYEAYGAKLRYDFGAFSVTSMSSYLNHREHDTLDYGEYLGIPSYPLYEAYEGHVSSEEVNISSNGSGPWRWSGGAIYRDGQNSTSQTLPVFATLDWTDSSRSYAVFGELSHRFLDDKLEWTLGGRYFHDDVTSQEGHSAPPESSVYGYYRAQDSFNATTPRAVLTWKPVEHAMIYASYSEGFRSGAPQAYYSVNGVPGFPAVKPDKLHNFEIGAKADLLDALLSIDAAFYYMKWKDVQQVILVPFKATIVGVVLNGQSASGPGADFGLTVRPLKGLELVGNISWNDLTLDSDVLSGGATLFHSGDRLNSSPKYTASAAANYSFPLGSRGFQGLFSASLHSTSQLTERTVAAGSAYVTEGNTMTFARTSLSIMAPTNWELTLYGDNLNNEQGAVTRNPALARPLPDWDVRVRPRTIGLQLDYHY